MNGGSSYRSRIAAIAQRLGSDPVFGPGLKVPRFELVRHSADEIALFEEQLGVRLPEEYIRVLVETGSGAGPYYGLFAPVKVQAEIESLNEILQKEGRKLPKPNAPFPFQQSDADEICARTTIEASETLGRAVWLADGCVPICDQGCTFSGVLVIAGELRGTIWSVNDDSSVAEWRPGIRPPGLLAEGSLDSGRFVSSFKPRPLPSPPRPPTFTQWYESWLERLETDLADYANFKLGNNLR
jgi:hypothetical protein